MMRTVTVPASAGDRVETLRIEALHTTNRIIAALGMPIALWAAWFLWPESRTRAMAAVIGGVLIVIPAALPARALTFRRLSPVIGLIWVSALSWLGNGAFATTGLLMWTTGIVTAIAMGRPAAIGVVLGSSALLLSGPLTASQWLLPIAAETAHPAVLTRFLLVFAIMSVTIVAVAWAVIAPLERNLAAATQLVQHLRREQRARAALDLRLTQNDQDARVGMARRLQRHLHGRLTSLELSLTSAREGDDAKSATVDRAIASVGELIEQVRGTARQLRPVLLDEAGLTPSLEALARSQLDRTSIAYELDFQIARRLPPAVEVACYRIVQEALDNIVQHARATRARLTASTGAHEVEFVVEDNGIGFDVRRLAPGDPRDPSGMGLFGMSRRSDALGGTLRIDSAPDRGTRVHFTLPLPVAA